MKKALVLVLVLAILILTAGCSGGVTTDTPPAGSGDGTPVVEKTPKPVPAETTEPVTLSFMMNSPELTEYYHNMAEAYNEHTSGRVTIEMDILQNDYQTVLKTRLNSGQIPDMFMSSAYNDNKVFRDYTYDLDGLDFMSHIDPNVLNSVTLDGHITGYPFVLQSHAFIYNKDIFALVGIDKLPETLEELRGVCEKLQAAGFQPFASGFAEWWVLPQTTYPAMSNANGGDYAGLFTNIKNGTFNFGDLPEVDFAMDLLDLIKEYSGDKPLESTFDDQTGSIANGTAVMTHQGNWAEDSIRSANPDIDLGYILHPRSDGKAVLAVESNLTFRIASGENLQETLAWLEWLTTSDFGKNWIPQQVKQMSPQVGAAMPDSMLAQETAGYLASAQTCPWWIFAGPDGIEEPFGLAFQSYVAGTLSRDGVKDELTRLFQDAYEAEQ